MAGVNPGSLASQMPPRDDDIVRQIRDLWRALREQGSANTLQAAQFGKGGILVTDGGSITFLGTGALNTTGALTTSGSFSASSSITAGTSLNADSLAIIHNATVGASMTVTGTLSAGAVSATGDVSAGGRVVSAGIINSPGTKTNTVTVGYSAVYIDSSGNMGGNTSSRRYKTNIGPAGYDLDAFLALPAYAYQRTSDILEHGAAAPWFDGMMAEDVAPVLPLHVWYDEDGQVEGIRFEELVTPLIQAVKRERSERLAMEAQYEARISALERAAGIG